MLSRPAYSHLRPHNAASFFQNFLRADVSAGPDAERRHEAFQLYRAEAYGPQLKLPTGPYRTTYHSVLFLTQGSFEDMGGQHPTPEGAGQLLLVPAGQTAALLALSPDLRGYVLLIEPEFLATSFPRAGLPGQLGELARAAPGPVALSPVQVAALVGLCEVLLAEYARATPLVELVRTLLRALLLKIEQQYAALLALEPAVPSTGSRAEQLADRFLHLLATRYRAWHTVAAYADHLCITPNYLNRCVKRATGQPALTWIADTLVAEANVLLGVGRLTVAEAARELGFGNASYFGRFFRRRTGQTPSAYSSDWKARA